MSTTPGRFISFIDAGAVSDDDVTDIAIPGALQETLRAAAAGELDPDTLAKAITPYVQAVFVGENIGSIETLFRGADEVRADEVEVHKVFLNANKLPKITASARFLLDEVEVLDDEALIAWQEDNDFLTDAVTFFWVFGDDELVIGDHDGAGFEREADDADGDADDDDEG